MTLHACAASFSLLLSLPRQCPNKAVACCYLPARLITHTLITDVALPSPCSHPTTPCSHPRTQLSRQGFDPVFGARPVKRALQREVQTLLAQALLRGDFQEGDSILVEAAPDGTCLELHRGGGSSSSSTPQPPALLPNGVSSSVAAAGKAAAAAANGGLANGKSRSSSAASPDASGLPPAGTKKKVVRLVRKTRSGSSKETGEAANGSSSGKAAANGISRSGSSNGLQSVPLQFEDEEH